MNVGAPLREGVNAVLFVPGQPRIKGTVQAMVNPVALCRGQERGLSAPLSRLGGDQLRTSFS
ncbi:hypothetical protein BOO69_00515 [Sulfitobacter alexandrii]|uniref:Uncharacterized protein n=1 Tax=Sulfitobacter alexandrii TaxID=1917485 RepID=A0A1J0WCM6_9RHOB|nr:hypothetical protein [Sulfitobacter alexandrii]APE42060.1 hypothetical protein BOO69_00515 [Sulfitobacter alexandrii]